MNKEYKMEKITEQGITPEQREMKIGRAHV